MNTDNLKHNELFAVYDKNGKIKMICRKEGYVFYCDVYKIDKFGIAKRDYRTDYGEPFFKMMIKEDKLKIGRYDK